ASNAPVTAKAHRCRAISISSLFITPRPYEGWRRSHGRAVAVRATCPTNGGLQAITYLIISTGWVRAHRGGFYERESMGDRLKDKVALVSGAGSSGPGWGNGKATAVLLAREGAKVFAADLNLDAAVETKRIIESGGGICEVVAGNVSRADDVAAIVDACITAFGRIDILHNNVGI